MRRPTAVRAVSIVGAVLLLAAAGSAAQTLTREQQLSKLLLEERVLQLDQRTASLETRSRRCA